MTGRRIIFLIGGVVFCVAFVFWPPDEPKFAGRRVSDWINKLDHPHAGHLDFARRTPEGIQFGGPFRSEPASDACQAILRIGAPAVPYLARQLDRGDFRPLRSRGYYQRLWARLPKRLRSRIPEPREVYISRQAIVQILGLLGPAAAEGVPALARLTEQTNRFLIHYTLCALGDIGPPAAAATPVLLTCLSSGSIQVKLDAAYALAQIGSGDAATIQSLENLSEHEIYSIAATAAVALWRLEPTPARLAAVTHRVKVGDPVLRRAVVALVGQVALPRTGIESILLGRITDGTESLEVRIEAASALENVYSNSRKNGQSR